MSRTLRRTALALVGMLALVAGAAPAAPTVAAPVPGYGTIAGVVRGPGGTPAAGVEVTAMEADAGEYYLGAEATTDGTGRFTLEVQAGGYDLRVQDPRGRFALTDAGGLTVRGGATTTRDVTVAHGLALTGRVARADGGPVAGIRVDASVPDARDRFVERSATVAADGTYTVRGLHPGTWRVLVDPFLATDARYLAQGLDGRTYPDRDEGVGTAIAVSGDATLAPVTVRQRTPVVAGVVRGAGGRPVAGVTVHTDDENWWLDDDGEKYPGLGDTTDASGRYELRLESVGRRKALRVSTGATGYTSLPFSATVPGVGATRSVDVRLRSAAAVTASVRSTRKRSTVRVAYRPEVAGASRVARVTVRYKGTSGRARKVRGALDRSGTLTLRLTKAKRGVRTVKVHVAGNADAAAVTRTVKARIR